MKIIDVMTREFEIVREDATLLDAMQHLRECPLVEDEIGIKCVLVLDDEDRVAGILTQSDVVGEILFPYFVRDLAHADGRDGSMREEDFEALATWAAKVRVRDVMTRNPVCLDPGTELFDAADTLISQKVKSVPVTEDGKVVGIAYRSALYRSISEAVLAHAGSPPATQ